MFHLKTVPLVGQFENHVGTYSIFLQHIQQPLIWLVCMYPQLPEEMFEMMNFVAALIFFWLIFQATNFFTSCHISFAQRAQSFAIFTLAMVTVE